MALQVGEPWTRGEGRGARWGPPRQLCCWPTELPSHQTPTLREHGVKDPCHLVMRGTLLRGQGPGQEHTLGGSWTRGYQRGRRPPTQGPCPFFPLQFEAFYAGGLAPGWNLLVQGHSDSGEDK